KATLCGLVGGRLAKQAIRAHWPLFSEDSKARPDNIGTCSLGGTVSSHLIIRRHDILGAAATPVGADHKLVSFWAAPDDRRCHWLAAAAGLVCGAFIAGWRLIRRVLGRSRHAGE